MSVRKVVPLFERTEGHIGKLQVGQGVAYADSLSQIYDDTGKIPGRSEGVGVIMSSLHKETGGFEQVLFIRMPNGLETRKQSGDKTETTDVEI